MYNEVLGLSDEDEVEAELDQDDDTQPKKKGKKELSSNKSNVPGFIFVHFDHLMKLVSGSSLSARGRNLCKACDIYF